MSIEFMVPDRITICSRCGYTAWRDGYPCNRCGELKPRVYVPEDAIDRAIAAVAERHQAEGGTWTSGDVEDALTAVRRVLTEEGA